jgi:hypothetical protein
VLPRKCFVEKNENKFAAGKILDLILSLPAITDGSLGLSLKTANDDFVVRNLKCMYKL